MAECTAPHESLERLLGRYKVPTVTPFMSMAASGSPAGTPPGSPKHLAYFLTRFSGGEDGGGAGPVLPSAPGAGRLVSGAGPTTAEGWRAAQAAASLPGTARARRAGSASTAGSNDGRRRLSLDGGAAAGSGATPFVGPVPPLTSRPGLRLGSAGPLGPSPRAVRSASGQRSDTPVSTGPAAGNSSNSPLTVAVPGAGEGAGGRASAGGGPGGRPPSRASAASGGSASSPRRPGGPASALRRLGSPVSSSRTAVDDADDEYMDVAREHEWTSALGYGYLPSLEAVGATSTPASNSLAIVRPGGCSE